METELAAVLCAFLFLGEPEKRQEFEHLGRERHVRVDCETSSEVIEFGFDKRSSFDSVHQVLFAAQLTGKSPTIVLIDSDGIDDVAEFQIKRVADQLGIEYREFSKNYIVRLQMTQHFRDAQAKFENLFSQ